MSSAQWFCLSMGVEHGVAVNDTKFSINAQITKTKSRYVLVYAGLKLN